MLSSDLRMLCISKDGMTMGMMEIHLYTLVFQNLGCKKQTKKAVAKDGDRSRGIKKIFLKMFIPVTYPHKQIFLCKES